MLLSLVVWIGGIIFFASVLAPTVFGVLPTRQLAGSVVSPTLRALHWIGIVSGLVYLICSMSYARLDAGFSQPFAVRNVLVMLMIVLTLISVFVIAQKMESLRAELGVIDNVSPTDARRVEFNSLHRWSTRLEVGVLAMGLAVIWLTSKAFNS